MQTLEALRLAMEIRIDPVLKDKTNRMNIRNQTTGAGLHDMISLSVCYLLWISVKSCRFVGKIA